MPPSTSTAAPAGTSARTLGIFSSECSMNGCPPHPGLTVMHSAMSIAPATSASAPTGVPGLIARPTPAPRSRISPAV
jgi:hypothetical protein